MRIGVIGAGPAGLSLARLVAERGLGDVVVYELHREFSMKPCGWGVPVLPEDSLEKTIRKDLMESVVWEYGGYRVFLDGSLLYENKTRRVLGYIINKREFLERLSEGVEVVRGVRAIYRPGRRILVRGETRVYDIVVNAGGFYTQRRSLEKIPAIQYHLEGLYDEPEIPEIYFYSELVGYVWFFPEGRRRARVGVGGYADIGVLEAVLRKTIESRDYLRKSHVLYREGAYVTTSGIDHEAVIERDPYHIGEAVGAVMPATGEGIRPAIYTSIALFNSIKNNTDYVDELYKIDLVRAIEIQRRILDLEIMVSPETRRRFLMNTPEEILIRLSLGDISARDLLRLAMRRESLRALLDLYIKRLSTRSHN